MKRIAGVLEGLGIAVALTSIALWFSQAAVLLSFALPQWVIPAGLLLSVALLLLALFYLQRYAQELEAALAANETHLDKRNTLHEEVVSQLEASSHKELERFRSELAHGLRMPIAIVQGYAELLHGDLVSDPAVQKEYLQKIVQRTRYMSEVLSKQFSTLPATKNIALNCQSVDLMDLVHQVVDDMQTAAAGQGIAIQVVSTEARILIEADAYQLNRVFFNLLENAVKYMQRDGVITIRIIRQDDEISIMVKDDGLGLSEEVTVHIFEPDFQGSNRTSGSGHGLSMVRDTVEAHGGVISAESAPGRGMGIFITLPLRPTSASH